MVDIADSRSLSSWTGKCILFVERLSNIYQISVISVRLLEFINNLSIYDRELLSKIIGELEALKYSLESKILQEVQSPTIVNSTDYSSDRQQNVDMMEIFKLLANKPISIQFDNKLENNSIVNSRSGFSVDSSVDGNINNIQGDSNKVVQGNTTMTGDRTINTGGGNYNERIEGDYVQGNKYAGQPQSLAEAAAEIQALLKQLEQTYPTATTSEKMVVAAQAVDQIETNPLLKQRVINAIKEGSLAAFEKAIDNPVGAFVVHAIEGWQEVKKD